MSDPLLASYTLDGAGAPLLAVILGGLYRTHHEPRLRAGVLSGVARCILLVSGRRVGTAMRLGNETCSMKALAWLAL